MARRKILINTQKKLDALKEVRVNEEVVIEGELNLTKCVPVFGVLRIMGRLNFGFKRRG